MKTLWNVLCHFIQWIWPQELSGSCPKSKWPWKIRFESIRMSRQPRQCNKILNRKELRNCFRNDRINVFKVRKVLQRWQCYCNKDFHLNIHCILWEHLVDISDDDNSNIWVISGLVSVDYLFPWKTITFPWFFVYQVKKYSQYRFCILLLLC